MAVAERRTPIAPTGFDYTDVAEVALSCADDRSAQELLLAGVDAVPAVLGALVAFAHRYALRLELAPLSAPNHVLGWRILDADHDSITLTATGPIVEGVLVLRRFAATAALETSVKYRQPVLSRLVWATVGPVHRRVAPYLMRRAAAG